MPDTQIVQVDPENPSPELIERAAEVIKSGGLVAFPTETVYGLGANALDPRAVGKIFAAKGRPPTNPLIVHVPDLDSAARIAAELPASAELLAARFWPGPITFVLKKTQSIPDIVTAGGPTVAVRAPAHPVALGLLKACGLPVAAPSANRSNRISATRAEHAYRDLGGRIDMVLDAGSTHAGIESTVIDLTEDPAEILRPGPITAAQIEAVIGPVKGRFRISKIARSPGQLARHYAPHAQLELASDGEARVEELLEQGMSVAWLTFNEGPHEPTDRLEVVMMPFDPTDYAASLYAVLHAIDVDGLDRIVVDRPPVSPAWEAIIDRLTRASAPPE